MTGDSGPLDVATFELLAGRLESSPLVDTWEFTPDSRSPRALRVHLDAAAYPPPITAARLDIRWFETADYSIHYVETHPDERWECRWDRHRKRDAPRAHFHPPPNAGRAGASPLTSSHPLGVLFEILEWIRERVADAHEPS